jgi:hypothetical protein
MAFVFTAYFGFNGPNNDPDASRELLLNLLNDSDLTGFNLAFGTGSYGGITEPSAVVTVITTRPEADGQGESLRAVCLEYKHIAEQECVYITRREEDLMIV